MLGLACRDWAAKTAGQGRSGSGYGHVLRPLETSSWRSPNARGKREVRLDAEGEAEPSRLTADCPPYGGLAVRVMVGGCHAVEFAIVGPGVGLVAI